MAHSISTLLFILLFSICYAQDSTNTFDEEVFTIVEQMPQFPGGEHALDHYLRDSVSTPISAIQQNIKGKVIVQFIIDKEGNVTEVAINKGLHPMIDKVAYSVIQNMPKWNPGRQRGKPVKVFMVQPIRFYYYKSENNKQVFEKGRAIEEKIKDVEVKYLE